MSDNKDFVEQFNRNLIVEAIQRALVSEHGTAIAANVSITTKTRTGEYRKTVTLDRIPVTVRGAYEGKSGKVILVLAPTQPKSYAFIEVPLDAMERTLEGSEASNIYGILRLEFVAHASYYNSLSGGKTQIEAEPTFDDRLKENSTFGTW